jgi:RimJ/RimL family protein N-acetyltransferase
VNVRPAQLADVPECARLHTASSEAAYVGIAPPDPEGLARRERNWRTLFDGVDVAPYVVEVDGAIVSVLNVGPAREEESAGELFVIYVHPDWWGSGAGQLLIAKAHEVLGTRFNEAVLTVLAANPRARRFYERNGWTLDTVVTELHFGGEPTEVARYRKRLVSDT